MLPVRAETPPTEAPKPGLRERIGRVLMWPAFLLIGLIALSGADGWLRANGFLGGAERMMAEVTRKHIEKGRGFSEYPTVDFLIRGETHDAIVTDEEFARVNVGERVAVVVVWTPVFGPHIFFDGPGYLTSFQNRPTNVLFYLFMMVVAAGLIVQRLSRRKTPPTSVPITPPPAP